jgi:sortase A
MGERSRIMRSKRRSRVYGLVAAAAVILIGALLIGINLLTGDRTVDRVTTPTSAPNAEDQGKAAQQEAAFVANARQASAEQAKKEAAEGKAAAKQAQAEAQTEPKPAIPSDTTMYLTIPKLGLQDIPVQEGTSETVLSEGVGHVYGTGYPWVKGSNTYIAGHRLGYPGTISDHVFWGLPSLGIGDEVILNDSLGQTYTYRVSNILEVSPSDLAVTGPTGSDIVSLQTCIENYGDYWTDGPDWFVRYIVRANRVS